MSDSEHLRKIINILETVQTKSYIVEGTWAAPQTEKKARQLAKIMANPIPAKHASDVLGNLVGSDRLYDLILEIEKEKPNADVRWAVADTLNDWLQDRERFVEPWDDRAIKILNKVIRQHYAKS